MSHIHAFGFVCPETNVILSTMSTFISAPPNHRIRLDFRDEFHIEISDNCNYDVLELRDGPFGYSRLLGRYCGTQYPQVTTSSTRFELYTMKYE